MEALKALLLAEREARRAEVRERALLIEKLMHESPAPGRSHTASRPERQTLLDQLELQLFELQEKQAQADALAEQGERDSRGPSAPQAGAAAAPRPSAARVVYPAQSYSAANAAVIGDPVTYAVELAKVRATGAPMSHRPRRQM